MRMATLRSLKDKHRNGSGKAVWHIPIADYYSAKALVFFLGLIYLSTLQIGMLKMAGEQADEKPAERVELILNGDGRLFVITAGGKYLPITENEIKETVKDKDVVYHTAESVTISEYGILYVKYLGLMGTAKGITPGRAIKIER